MVRIYGASDDLIEVDGDVSEEFGANNSCSVEDGGNGAVLACSDGTLLSVRYDGCWRFAPIVQGSAAYSKVEGVEDGETRADGTPEYSDVITLGGDIAWVVLAGEHDWAKSARKVRAAPIAKARELSCTNADPLCPDGENKELA